MPPLQKCPFWTHHWPMQPTLGLCSKLPQVSRRLLDRHQNKPSGPPVVRASIRVSPMHVVNDQEIRQIPARVKSPRNLCLVATDIKKHKDLEKKKLLTAAITIYMTIYDIHRVRPLELMYKHTLGEQVAKKNICEQMQSDANRHSTFNAMCTDDIQTPLVIQLSQDYWRKDSRNRRVWPCLQLGNPPQRHTASKS